MSAIVKKELETETPLGLLKEFTLNQNNRIVYYTKKNVSL